MNDIASGTTRSPDRGLAIQHANDTITRSDVATLPSRIGNDTQTVPSTKRIMTQQQVINEPFAVRWKRRSVTIPTMLLGTAAVVFAAPVVAPMLFVADIARARWKLPMLRLYAFAAQYAVNDSIEILLAPWYWILARFGTTLRSSASIRRHERVQRWSVAILARRAEQLLGIRVELDDIGAVALLPTPAIVLCRHVNVIDASLPSLLYQQRDRRVRDVIMAELLADPGFDLFYGRLGSIFIPRDNGPEARHAVTALGASLDANSVAVIFPEGRLFRPELLERAKAKLAERDPARIDGIAQLRHVLPPRPGGVNALLDALPSADVVVIAHFGLDPYPDFKSLIRNVPAGITVNATAWRIARRDIPNDPAARMRWLDATWQSVDDWIDLQGVR